MTRLKSDRFILLACVQREQWHGVQAQRSSLRERPHQNERKKKRNGHRPKKKTIFFVNLRFFVFYFYIFFVQIQNNKQIASSLKAKNSNRTAAAAAHLSPGAIAAQRIISRWSNDEYQLAIKGMQMHGKDFQAVAEILGTKNESQVNQFYTSNRKKYNLDEIIKEFEAKQQQKQQQQKQKMNDAQQKMAISSSSTDTKADIKKHISDDDIMEVSNNRSTKWITNR